MELERVGLLKKTHYFWHRPREKHRKGSPEQQAQFKKNLPLKAQKIRQQQLGVKVEIWFFDEHRIGLKPILRTVWSKKGKRPIAKVEHHDEWLYIWVCRTQNWENLLVFNTTN